MVRVWVAVALVFSVMAAYLLNHQLGFPVHQTAWAFWLPNGVLVAFLLRRPLRDWWFLALAFLVGKQLTTFMLSGAIWSVAQYQTGMANVLEAVLAAGLAQRFAPHVERVADVRRVLVLFFVAVIIAPILPALLAAQAWSDGTTPDLLNTARDFYLGDSLGILVATPPILAWWQRPDQRSLQWPGATPEAITLGLATVILAIAVFAVPQDVWFRPFPYLLVPVLVWGPARFGPRGGSTQVAIVAVIAVGLTARGYGPFGLDPEINRRVASLQLFLAVTAVSTATLAALIHHRRQQEERERQNQTLAALGQLAARVAHDFNNELAVILLSCDPDVQPDIHRSALRSRTLVEELLAFGRDDHAEAVPLRPVDLIVDLASMLRRTLGDRHRLVTRFERPECEVKTVPHDLKVALINLVANARDAMPHGGEVTVDVHVESATIGSNRVVISVHDQGIGIPPEDLPNVFKPFFTTKSKGQGTGLGLTTVAQVAERCGGTVRARPGINGGTVVSIVLPEQ